MKNAGLAMLGMFALIVFPGGSLWYVIKFAIGGGVAESYLYPIYGGIILLAGLVVLCTKLVLEELETIHKELEELKKDRSEQE